MRDSRYLLAALVAGCSLLFVSALGVELASAHQSGCHAAHSCPSDTGSYVCGDTGNYNFCPGLAVTPTVSASKPTIGTALTALVSWSAHPTAVTYQWSRDGIAIPGAVGLLYVVTAEDIGKSLTLTISGSDGRGQLASGSSVPIVPTVKLSISLRVSKVKAGKALKFRGYADAEISVASLPITVKLWQEQGRRWKLKRTVKLTTNESGDFSVSQKTGKRSATTWKARATFAGVPGVPAVGSATKTVTTRKYVPH